MTTPTVPPYKRLPLGRPRPAGAPLALEGVRIIDFTRYLAGPYCTQSLADLGAEVIKVESPQGDETRSYQPPDIEGQSPYFLGLNRNKKSIAINLATDAGRQVARDLVAKADVVVENFSPGVMKRFGLDHPTTSRTNRRLVHCAITGYGSTGSHADQPGFDSVFQAESGFASLTGDPDRLPMRTGTPIIDIAAAMNATSTVLAALVARERLGVGQYVEVAMYDTALALLAYFSMNFLASGKDPVRAGNTAPVATPIGMFETAQGGPIYVSCGTQRSWEKLATGVLERPDLLDDPEYADNRSRNRNKSALMGLLAEVFRKEPREHWIALARRERVPVGAVRSVGEALLSELAAERGLVTRTRGADGREAPNISSPFRFDATPVADPLPAPLLAEHEADVLERILGYDAPAIAEARARGAFGEGKEGA